MRTRYDCILGSLAIEMYCLNIDDAREARLAVCLACWNPVRSSTGLHGPDLADLQ